MSMDIRSFFSTTSKKKGTDSKHETSAPVKTSSKKRKDTNSSIEDIIPETPDFVKKKKNKKDKIVPEIKRRKIILLSDSDSETEKSPKKNGKKADLNKYNKPKDKDRKYDIISTSESDDEKKKVKYHKPVVNPIPRNNFKKKEVVEKQKKIVNPFDAFGNAPLIQKKVEKSNKLGTELGIHNDEDFEKTLTETDELELISEVMKNDVQIGEEKTKPPVKNDTKPVIEKNKSPMKNYSQIVSEKKKTPVKTNPAKVIMNNFEQKTKYEEPKKTDDRSQSKSPKSQKSPIRCVDSASSSTSTTTPGRKRKLSESENSADTDQERYEKKRYSAMLYQKYLNRSGPAHLHSKWIPEGKKDCLKDLGFLITGVMDSLTRDEAEEFIVKHGGRCTKTLSKKIKYLVVGEDAGPAKLEKARDLGTIIISENDLIDLVCRKSGIENKNKSSKKSDNEIKKQRKTDEKIIKKKAESPKRSGNINLGNLVKQVTKETISDDDDEIPSVTIKDKELKPNAFYKISKTKIDQPSTTTVPKPKPVSIPEKEIPEDQLAWVDKYKPSDMKGIIGQQGDNSNAKKLYKWLKSWYKNQDGKTKLIKPSPWAKNDDGAYFKAALLSGPPGVGKTTTATIVSKELGFDTVEFNASDTRSKKMLGDEISTLLKTKSLSSFFKDGSAPTNKHVLLMDEVDGMSGNEDRGGMQELINLIKTSNVPIICMCNDRQHPKIRSLANYCFDLRFTKPRLEQIRGAMMSVCFKEDIKISSEALFDVIMGAGMDIRQTLNNLSMWSMKEHEVSKETAKKESSIAVKDVKLGPWEVIRKVFSEEEHKNMTIDDKYGLFFYDYSINPLFVQENYLQVKPRCSSTEVLKRFALAADSISLGDLVDSKIRSNQSWGLLDTQALFSSVIPGHTLVGHIVGQINFPGWLGKNSKTNKFKRMTSELQTHMRMSITGGREAVNLDYLSHIYNSLITPLIKDGMNGISKAIGVMQEYHLMREDLTNIVELVHWPRSKDLFKNVDPKVKAAFTRAYNKDIVLPYAITAVPIKKRRGGGGDDDISGEEEEDAEEEENDDIDNNPMIKVKKQTTKTESKISTKGKQTKPKESKTKGPTKPRGKRGK